MPLPTHRPFKQVDVFTNVPMRGNPVAVILDAQGLDTPAMQAIANWTNLSETTFVFPATQTGADYAVRIFTPQSELPFAGHPTLGTAHAVVEAGIVVPVGGIIHQQSVVGIVPVEIGADRLSFRLPPHRFEPLPEETALRAAMKADAVLVGSPRIVNVGPRWVIAQFADEAGVDQFAPDMNALADYDRTHGTTGLTIFAKGGDGLVVRSFAPADGLMEDPVCGSGNGAVAAYRLDEGAIGEGAKYIARQGYKMGRDGHVSIEIRGRDIHVGGQCVTCVDGVFKSP
jgi:PhzF family phenazine biosynthesis protein